MKKIISYIAIFAGLLLFMNACKEPQKIHPAPYPEEGVYITGSSIKTDSISLDARMSKAIVVDADGDQIYRDSLFSVFMYVTTSGNGFVVNEQVGNETLNFGIDGSWTESKAGVMTATVKQDGSNFTVPDDGFYFFAIDLITMKAYLFNMNTLTFDGDAVAGNKKTVTLQNGTVDSATWAGNGIEIKTGSLKILFYTADKYDLPDDTVSLVTYLGDAVTAPVYGGKEIEIVADQDTFSFNFKYVFGKGFSGSTTLPPYDPRTHTWSLIGDAFYTDNDPNGSPTAWNVDFDLTFDASVSDTANGIYKFVINGQYFIGGKTFKIRADHDWIGLEMGYPDVDGITGDVNNFTDDGTNYHNFKVLNDAQYDVTFTYDAVKNKKYVDFTATQK